VFPEVPYLTICPANTDPLDVARGSPQNVQSNIRHDHGFEPAGKSSQGVVIHFILN
jgi:hypothetical protein